MTEQDSTSKTVKKERKKERGRKEKKGKNVFPYNNKIARFKVNKQPTAFLYTSHNQLENVIKIYIPFMMSGTYFPMVQKKRRNVCE